MKLTALLRSKLFLGITAVVVTVTAVATGLILKNRTDEYRVIKVFEVIGRALVTRESLGELEPYSGMNLQSGDTVETDSDGSLRMILDNTKFILMEPDSCLELEASGNASDNKTIIVLKKGSILNEITESLSDNSIYEVRAPKATMAVCGTSFRVKVEKDEYGDYITTLYVFHGTVKVNLLDEEGNPTDQTVDAVQDECIIIKTVHNENTQNDASDDGFSFFVRPDGNGGYTPVAAGESPVTAIDYASIPFDTLKEIFETDNEEQIKLFSPVLAKVIAAMYPETESAASDTETTTTTSTTTTKAATTTPKRTASTTAATTTTAKAAKTTSPQQPSGAAGTTAAMTTTAAATTSAAKAAATTTTTTTTRATTTTT
ncbi:MAG: FecR domain-containing protein, partial [Oscillospiraceae bacterium]|nr:FecR domain-containing protein [Oscillospiraceae bacterium]